MNIKSIAIIIVLIFASLTGLASADYGQSHCEHNSPTAELMEMSGSMVDCDARHVSCDVDISHCSSFNGFYANDVKHLDHSAAVAVSSVVYEFHLNSHISNPAFIPPIV
jgi:hypothetical protein